MRLFKCPICKKVSTSTEWNNYTQEVLQDSEGIVMIERVGKKDYLDFYCPMCDSPSRGQDIKEIE